VAVDHTLVGVLAIAMTALATAAIAAGGFLSLGPIGLESLIIIAIYVFGMHAVYRAIAVAPSPPTQLELGATGASVLASGVRGFVLAAAAILIVAPLLVIAGQAVAVESGQSETLIGTALVGLTTSFPELGATVAAVRMRAFDLAVGNIFGSNAFNLCIFFAMDVAYGGLPLAQAVSPQHVVSGQFAVLVLALGVLGILARANRRIADVRLESCLIVAAYGALIVLLLD
jgi:cation:H+ antiporter